MIGAMKEFRRHLDAGSVIVIVLTLALFVLAVFLKGIGHELLLEAGVFLVSVKLILMSHKNSVAEANLAMRLQELEALLRRALPPAKGDPG